MKRIKCICLILLLTIISYTILQLFGNQYTYGVSQQISTDINGINASAYPGIKERIQSLKAKYPNWNFKILYTNLDWNTVISKEYEGHGGSPKNLVPNTRNSNWICSICGNRAYDNGTWRCASQSAISYVMDPRNSLNEIDIFQFEELTGTNAQLSIVQSMTKGTFLQGHEQGIVNTANNYQINAYYIVARLIQEQGRGGSTLVSGQSGYYNAFNIGASGSTSSQVIQNGIAYAKRQGWNTLEKSIDGGIQFVAKEYIRQGQNTLYLQKFNVTATSTYWHQYQQNLTAAGSEGSTLRSTYQSVNALSSSHTFIIPVYTNMPQTAALNPELVNSNLPTSDLVKINVTSSLKLRKSPQDATLVAWLWKDEVVARLEKATTKINGTYWDKVQKSNGQIGYTARETFDYESPYKLYLIPLNGETTDGSNGTATTPQEKVKIDEQNANINVKPNVTVEDILETFGNSAKIVNSKGEQIKDKNSAIGTGCKINDKYTIVKYGDSNGDGNVNSADALEVLKQSVGILSKNNEYLKAMDTNKDGQANSQDALMILKNAVGLQDISI